MNGPKDFMVTKLSAERIGHLARDIEHLPSQADHRGLVRFEHCQDRRYLSVIEKLRRMTAALKVTGLAEDKAELASMKAAA